MRNAVRHPFSYNSFGHSLTIHVNVTLKRKRKKGRAVSALVYSRQKTKGLLTSSFWRRASLGWALESRNNCMRRLHGECDTFTTKKVATLPFCNWSAVVGLSLSLNFTLLYDSKAETAINVHVKNVKAEGFSRLIRVTSVPFEKRSQKSNTLPFSQVPGPPYLPVSCSHCTLPIS